MPWVLYVNKYPIFSQSRKARTREPLVFPDVTLYYTAISSARDSISHSINTNCANCGNAKKVPCSDLTGFVPICRLVYFDGMIRET